MRKLTNKQLHAKRKAAGECTRCGATPRPGLTLCEKCAVYTAKSSKRKRKSHKAKGLCSNCGKPARQNKTLCETCAHRDAMRNGHGATLEDRTAMYSKQGKFCAICGKSEESEGRYLSVDHNHATGQLRGLLCSACNFGIGSLKDSARLLRNAVTYLESYDDAEQKNG